MLSVVITSVQSVKSARFKRDWWPRSNYLEYAPHFAWPVANYPFSIPFPTHTHTNTVITKKIGIPVPHPYPVTIERHIPVKVSSVILIKLGLRKRKIGKVIMISNVLLGLNTFFLNCIVVC